MKKLIRKWLGIEDIEDIRSRAEEALDRANEDFWVLHSVVEQLNIEQQTEVLRDIKCNGAVGDDWEYNVDALMSIKG